MAHVQIKSRRKTSVTGLRSDYLNGSRSRRNRNEMGLGRTLLSALSLCLGGSLIFVGLHYVPAFVHPKNVLKLASGDSAALKTYKFDRNSKTHQLLGPFTQLFHMDRAYMKSGQSIHIKYDLPDGAYANLNIIQCRSDWVVEIFNCEVVSRFDAKTKRQNGVESFALKQSGFYYFKHEAVDVPAGEPFRIVWERGQ